MTNDSSGAATVVRLIAIKREELDRFRQDLGRMVRLVELGEAQFDRAKQDEQAFLEEIRQAEQRAQASLDAKGMIERRRYLMHLQNETEKKQVALDQALEQQKQARRSLEKAFAEMRSLERLAEHRQTRAAAERQRLEYLRADDQEITKTANRRLAHVQY